ncbi:MAG: hypothetical protein JHC54_00405 [Acinetobacter sp.]|nr:hypothetical protein [Acinetobacter sp.]
MTDVSENKYSPDQIFSNDQIDQLRMQVTWCGGTIADEIYWEGYSESPLSIIEKQMLISNKMPKGV